MKRHTLALFAVLLSIISCRAQEVAWSKLVFRSFEINKLDVDGVQASLLSLRDANDDQTDFNGIIYNAIIKGAVKTYSDYGCDSPTVANGTLELLHNTNHNIADSNTVISKYLLVEKWAFDKPTRSLMAQIVAIGPCDNTTPLKDLKPLFWIKYEELKPVLSSSHIKPLAGKHFRMSCEEYFRNRKFTSVMIQTIAGSK